MKETTDDKKPIYLWKKQPERHNEASRKKSEVKFEGKEKISKNTERANGNNFGISIHLQFEKHSYK